jgi:glucosamine-phosphate N-acetyltransferase
MSVSIYPAFEHDLPAILEIINEFRPAISLDFARYVFRERQNNEIQIWVAEDYSKSYEGRQIVGLVSFFVEPKFYHGGKSVLHIEDLIVKKEYQGKGIGKVLVKEIIKLFSSSCYKVILNCSDEVVSFYEKLGFKRSGNEMRYETEDLASTI